MELEELEGEILAGRFRLGSLLGKGGYGAVFSAEQISIGRPCAIKVLHAKLLGEENAAERFRAEAFATSKLTHPNSVVIYDFGEDERNGLLFLAMEYLEGVNLNDMIKEHGSLPLDDVVRYAEQIAQSLQDAHNQGVVHRDMKPHNVMLVERGSERIVKVIDFGIAKVLQESSSPMENLTQTGVMVGTPHYMAPEQIRGEEIDGRTDIYSLAICIYKMILGQTPFSGGTPVDVAVAQLTEAPKPLRHFDPNLPVNDAFEQVLLMAMKKEIDRRWETMDAFATALRNAYERRGQAASASQQVEDVGATSVIDTAQFAEEDLPSGGFDSPQTPAAMHASTPPAVTGKGEPPTAGMSAPPDHTPALDGKDVRRQTLRQGAIVAEKVGDAPPESSQHKRSSGQFTPPEDLLAPDSGAMKMDEVESTLAVDTGESLQPALDVQAKQGQGRPNKLKTVPTQAVSKDEIEQWEREQQTGRMAARTAHNTAPGAAGQASSETMTTDTPQFQEEDGSQKRTLMLVGGALGALILLAGVLVIGLVATGDGDASEQETEPAIAANDDPNTPQPDNDPEPVEPPPEDTEPAAPATVDVTFEAFPKGATLLVDGEEAKGFSPDAPLAIEPGAHTLQARLDGEVVDTQEIEVQEGTPLTVSLEAPKPGVLTVEMPRKATLYVNGEEAEVSKDDTLELKAGTYTISAKLGRTELGEEKVTLKEDGEASVEFEKPEPKEGTVKLVVIPGGNKLWVDGRRYGNGVPRAVRLKEGRYTLQVEFFSGAKSERKIVRVRGGREQAITFREQ